MKQAYEQALSYAEYAADWMDEESEERSVSGSEKEEKAPEDGALDFSDISNRDLEPQKTESEQTENIYEFDQYIEQGNRKNEDERRRVLGEATRIYYSKKRNNFKQWNDYFMSQEFSSLQKDKVFTEKYLEFFVAHREFNSRLWKKVFVPVFHEWSFAWAGSQYQALFQRVAQPIPKTKTRFSRQQVMAFCAIFGILIAILRVSIMQQKGTEPYKPNFSYYSAVQQNNKLSDKQQQYFALIEITNGIILKESYQQLKNDCNTAHISEDKFNSLVQLYNEKGEKDFRSQMVKYAESVHDNTGLSQNESDE